MSAVEGACVAMCVHVRGPVHGCWHEALHPCMWHDVADMQWSVAWRV